MATREEKSSLASGDKPSEDTTKAVQLLLETMQSRFQQLSERIINRIDDMGNRIDDLERSIAVLMKDDDENNLPVTTSMNTVAASPSGKLVTSVRTPTKGKE